MRIIVLFDLPTTTRANKRAYVLFRRFLLNDGYDMIQWSVYARMVNSQEAGEKHLRRLTINLPDKGSVRCMSVTEKQFAAMRLLVGEPSAQEKKGGSCQLLLF